jgi:hypothetical protein
MDKRERVILRALRVWLWVAIVSFIVGVIVMTANMRNSSPLFYWGLGSLMFGVISVGILRILIRVE